MDKSLHIYIDSTCFMKSLKIPKEKPETLHKI